MAIIPGTDKLLESLPELATPRGFLRGLLTVLAVFGVTWYLLRFLEQSSPFLAFVVQLLVYVLLRWFVAGFFRGRQDRMSYTEGFFNRFLPATGLNLASALFVLTTLAGGTADVPAARLVPLALGALVGAYLVVSALLLFYRAIQTVGVDTLAGLYVYYPNESQQVDRAAYGVLRHPVYAAIDRLVLAFALFNGTAFALLLGVVFVFVWHPIWYGLEERELIDRFGEAYRSYREQTPAVIPQGVWGERALWQSLIQRG